MVKAEDSCRRLLPHVETDSLTAETCMCGGRSSIGLSMDGSAKYSGLPWNRQDIEELGDAIKENER